LFSQGSPPRWSSRNHHRRTTGDCGLYKVATALMRTVA
jgi:hypothetical protein